MTLYEIDKALCALIDNDTGEVSDIDALEQLQIDRDVKIENIACYVKNLKSDAQAIKAEIDALTERKTQCEAKQDRLTKLLAYALGGEKYESAKVSVGYRKSKAVEIEDECKFVEWASKNSDALLKYQPPKIDKAAVKMAINGGAKLPGATIAEKTKFDH